MRQQFTQSWIEYTRWYKDGDIIDEPPYNHTAYVGKITTQCDATDYNGTLGMADATVEALADAKKIKITPPPGAPALAFRFRTDGSAGDDNIIQIYAAADVDHYQHIVQLTLTQGTQLYSTGIYFDDGVVEANVKWYSTTTALHGTDNYVGGWVSNLHGSDRILILCSDLDTTTQYVDWRVIP